jgi:hypothetical protein
MRIFRTHFLTTGDRVSNGTRSVYFLRSATFRSVLVKLLRSFTIGSNELTHQNREFF